MTQRRASPDSTEPLRTALWLAGAWSLLATVLGGWWLAAPGGYPFGPDNGWSGLVRHLPVQVGCVALIALGALGVGATVTRAASPALASRGMVVFAAGYALVFALLTPDGQLLVVLGYLVATAAPLTVVVGLALAVRTRLAATAAACVVAAVAAAGVLTGVTDAGAIADFFTRVAHGLVTNVGLRPFVLLFFVAGGLLWAAVAVLGHRDHTGRCARCGRPGAWWTGRAAAARWGRPVTYAAAACALPYGLLRMTWLTPWPLGADGVDLAAEPAIRLTGLLLGSAALGGFVLTLGLVRGWGERWPRWVPRLRGRPVPVLAAVVPGALVAAALCTAALSLTPSFVAAGVYAYAFVIPFPVWGPLLAAATYAYFLRRRPECPYEHTNPRLSGTVVAPAPLPQR